MLRKSAGESWVLSLIVLLLENWKCLNNYYNVLKLDLVAMVAKINSKSLG